MADPILTVADMAALEDVVSSSSFDSMLIERATTTQSPMFTAVKTWATVTTVEGRLIPGGRTRLTEDEKVIASKFQGRAIYKLQMPENTDIRLDDRVTCKGHILRVVTNTDNGNFTIRQLPLAVEFTNQ